MVADVAAEVALDDAEPADADDACAWYFDEYSAPLTGSTVLMAQSCARVADVEAWVAEVAVACCDARADAALPAAALALANADAELDCADDASMSAESAEAWA